jgi:hypothetical protein
VEVSYEGLIPVIKKSGIRANRCNSISNKKLLKTPFLYAFNICKHTKSPKCLKSLVWTKSKSKKLALVEGRNRLLKQAFSITKSILICDATYRGPFVKIRNRYSVLQKKAHY